MTPNGIQMMSVDHIITYEQSKAICDVRREPVALTEKDKEVGMTSHSTLLWVFKDEVQEWIDAANFPVNLLCGMKRVRLTFENEADRRLFCYYWQI